MSETKGSKKVKKAKALQSPNGMHDILPQDQVWWERVRKESEATASKYNFIRIDTPILESIDVFEKSLGSTSDIVEKQMFTLKGGSKDKLVMRPENTAAIVRAYIQHGLSHLGQPLKLFYIGPMFRKERTQAGRYRQFHQMGFEIIGNEADPVYDAQTILAMYRFLERLKIKDLVLKINSIGCRVCRPNYRKKLVEYYKGVSGKLCIDCKRRIKQNPLRLLDCKQESCQEFKADAPIMLDSLCSSCSKHFKHVLEFLDELKLPYQFDNHLVRGLDYYSKTVFEIFTGMKNKEGESFDFALAGGGRYDYLFDLFGAKQPNGVGAAAGLDRIIDVMKQADVSLGLRNKASVFFIHIGDYAKKRSLVLMEDLRSNGILIKESLGKSSLGAQLRTANKEGSEFALIFGQKEAFEESIIIRDLTHGVQEIVPLDKMVKEIKKRLN